MDRNKIKEQTEFLSKEYKKNPELFLRETFVDSPEFLETIGISFDNQENLPKGCLKLWPSDFIVEEIPVSEKIQTVYLGDFFDPKKIGQQGKIFNTTLIKCGILTFQAVEGIASFLNIEKEKVKFSGLKDESAITSQRISINVPGAEKLENLKNPYFYLKDSSFSDKFVGMGYLKGNKFTLLIRTDDTFDANKFEENLKNIQKNGFYNFFYSQRFSSPRFVNWFWGLLILKGDYRNAVMSYLCTEGQREFPFFRNLRQEFKEHFGDWTKIKEEISPISTFMPTEYKIVSYLEKHPSDFAGALNQVSEQTQLWVSAYGSLLFNRKISEHIANEKPLPETLPLILSEDKNDWIEYFEFLKEDGITALPTKNLKPFPNIILKKREVKTKQTVQVHNVKIIPQGVVMSFSLPKGCYATTFLAHLFLLDSDAHDVKENVSDKIVDIKESLGEKPIKDVIERFTEVFQSKKEGFW